MVCLSSQSSALRWKMNAGLETLKLLSWHVAAPELFQKTALVQIFHEAAVYQIRRLFGYLEAVFSGDFHRLRHGIGGYDEPPIDMPLCISIIGRLQDRFIVDLQGFGHRGLGLFRVV